MNLAQGMPDFPAPPEVKAAACRAIEADINQYAITWGAADLRQAIAEHAAWHLGLEVDPETEITVTCGSTEAMLVALLSTDQPGRRGDPLAAVLRELLARLRPRRCHAPVRPRPAPRLDLRPRRARRRVQRQDQGDHPLQPEQPDRHRLHPRRARAGRRALPEVGRHRRSPTRSTSTSSTTAARTSRWPTLDGMQERTGHDRRDVEDLRRDRLAGRHDDRAAAPDPRLPPGPRLRLDRRRRPAPGRRGRGLSPASRPTTTRLAADYQARRDRFCSALVSSRLRARAAPGRLLRDGRHLGLRRDGRRRILPLSRPRDRRRDRPRLELLPRQGLWAATMSGSASARRTRRSTWRSSGCGGCGWRSDPLVSDDG